MDAVHEATTIIIITNNINIKTHASERGAESGKEGKMAMPETER